MPLARFPPHRRGVNITWRQDKFNRDVNRAVQNCKVEARKFVRRTMLNLMRLTVSYTPYKTGQARAGWFAIFDELGAPSMKKRFPVGTGEGVAEGESKSRAYSRLGKGEKKPFAKVVNMVEYIRLLEYGSSRQSPKGMLRVAMMQVRLNWQKGFDLRKLASGTSLRGAIVTLRRPGA